MPRDPPERGLRRDHTAARQAASAAGGTPGPLLSRRVDSREIASGASARGERGPRHWLVLLALLLAVLTLQALSGALTAELATADEPAHFVSGLLVRDYLAGGLGSPPLDFAREYYSHYPKIAIGNWPPLFYGVLGVWLLPLPAAAASAVLLMTLITALLGWLVYRALQPVLGTACAIFGAGLLIVLRPVQAYAGMVMLENALALIATAAMLLWARFLTQGSLRDAGAFGLLALVGLLTKGNAIFLALLPPLAIVVGRRWDVLRSRALWLTALALLLLAGPWMWYFLDHVRTGWKAATPSVAYAGSALAAYAPSLVQPLGVAGAVLLALGIWARIPRTVERTAEQSLWISAASLILAVLLLHVIVPAGIGTRHLIPAFPALIMFVAAGAYQAAAWLSRRGVGDRTATALVIGSAALVFGSGAFRLADRADRGYRAAALAVLEHAAAVQPTTMLIVSDAVGEGSFIVEVASRDRDRPSHTVWRGSNLLALNTWAGRRYRMRAASDPGVLQLLEEAAIRYIVIDRAAFSRHQRQLQQVVRGNPERFHRVAALPLRRNQRRYSQGLVVYEMLAADGRAAAPRIRQVPGYDGVEAVPGSSNPSP